MPRAGLCGASPPAAALNAAAAAPNSNHSASATPTRAFAARPSTVITTYAATPTASDSAMNTATNSLAHGLTLRAPLDSAVTGATGLAGAAVLPTGNIDIMQPPPLMHELVRAMTNSNVATATAATTPEGSSTPDSDKDANHAPGPPSLSNNHADRWAPWWLSMLRKLQSTLATETTPTRQQEPEFSHRRCRHRRHRPPQWQQRLGQPDGSSASTTGQPGWQSSAKSLTQSLAMQRYRKHQQAVVGTVDSAR